MGILIITPPSVFLLNERVFVNLGILKVAACLEQAGHKVESLDLSGRSIEDFQISNDIEIVAITVTTPQLPAVVEIVKRIRKIRSDIKIIVGGPHITLTVVAAKKGVSRAVKSLNQLESLFDVLISGDGELAILEAVKDNAPKLIDADSNPDLFMDNAIYEASPYPARHLIDLDSYHYSIDGHRAFGCNFCGGRYAKSMRRIRTRSIKSIISEIELLNKTYGYTGFMLYDDEININHRNFIELCNILAPYNFRLRGFVKSELFNEEQAEAMYRAGFRWLLCGFEAANNLILQNMNKTANVEDNTRTIQIAKKYGLKVKALMSVGHAGESKESIQDIKHWLLDMKPDDFDCTIITIFPGTPYFDDAIENSDLPGIFTFTCKKSGDRLHSYDIDFMKTAEYYKGDPNGGYHSYVFTDYLSAEQIVQLRDDVEKTVREKLNIPFNS